MGRGAGFALAVVMILTMPACGQTKKILLFTNEKPVLGLPVAGEKAKAHCAADGVTYFSGADGPERGAGADLYGVSADGAVKGMRRKLPEGFSHVTELDFFAGEHELVSLLKAERGDDDAGHVRETGYFLSIADHDGDFGKVVALDVKFRPLKVGMFGSGEVLVLGWDAGNLLPVLVTMKEDGTIRRFVDVDERGLEPGRGASVSMKAQERAVVLKDLEGAAFVPYGADVMVTYPGTARGIRVLSGSGASRTIPIMLPAGYVLRDALVADAGSLVVVRARLADTAGGDLRMFEMHPTHGYLIREILFSKPKMAEVTCATGYSLTAIFLDTVANPDAAKKDEKPAMQLVVSKVSRVGR